MMKIDCIKFFFYLCLCMLLPEQTNVKDGTPTLNHNCCCSPWCKKEKDFCSHLLPIMMHKLNICNSGFALIFTPDFEHSMQVFDVPLVHPTHETMTKICCSPAKRHEFNNEDVNLLQCFNENLFFLNYLKQFKQTNKIEPGHFLQKTRFYVYSMKPA